MRCDAVRRRGPRYRLAHLIPIVVSTLLLPCCPIALSRPSATLPAPGRDQANKAATWLPHFRGEVSGLWLPSRFRGLVREPSGSECALSGRSASGPQGGARGEGRRISPGHQGYDNLIRAGKYRLSDGRRSIQRLRNGRRRHFAKDLRTRATSSGAAAGAPVIQAPRSPKRRR